MPSQALQERVWGGCLLGALSAWHTQPLHASTAPANLGTTSQPELVTLKPPGDPEKGEKIAHPEAMSGACLPSGEGSATRALPALMGTRPKNEDTPAGSSHQCSLSGFLDCSSFGPPCAVASAPPPSPAHAAGATHPSGAPGVAPESSPWASPGPVPVPVSSPRGAPCPPVHH